MITNAWAVRVSGVAVRAALVSAVLAAGASRAAAQDPDEAAKAIEAAKTAKTSTVEVGIGSISQDSYKAAEYNGLQSKGAVPLLNLDLRGAAAYDGPSAVRWSVKSTDLGLESRGLKAQVGVQGRYRLMFGYDQLRRNRSDTYQTPYAGDGTDALTLPATWLLPNIASPAGNTTSARGLVKTIGGAPFISTAAATQGALTAPTSAQVGLVNAAADADLPAFRNVDLFTTRKKFDVGVNLRLGDRWGLAANVTPEHKEGLKPMATVSRSVGGDISAIIPDRVDTDHTQVNLSASFKGAKSFGQMGYYGSSFTNNVASMSWQNWAALPGATGSANTMSSTPSNAFGQFNGSYGVNLSRTTKLVASGSYGRMTQNDAFMTDASTPVVPVSSLNGLVVTTMFNTRYTAKVAKKVNLVAAYKFNDRDNRTAINIYQYADAGEAATVNAAFPAGGANTLGAVVAQNANANRPNSRTANLATFEADYAVARGQWIKAGYDYEHIARACPGAWINCADAATNNENTLRAEWRANGGIFNARVAYAYSARRTPNYDENAFLALVPYANVSPTTATGGLTTVSYMNSVALNGWGPALGFSATTGNQNVFFPSNNALANAMYANANRISELSGMRRYYVADRNRDKARASVNVQATEALTLFTALDLNQDDYPSSAYGVQNAKSWALNLDGNYALGKDLAADVFYTYESQRSTTRGNTYTANSNASTVNNGQPGVVGLSGNTCNNYTTLQQRNNNNKLDPCLDWSAAMPGTANTFGAGLTQKAGRVDVVGNLIISRARWDNTVTGGNYANNILNGAGAPPTTVAAWFIPATALPTVTSDTAEFQLSGKVAVRPHQSLKLSYAYLQMSSADWIYEGMQFGSLSGVLPTNEQAFNYKVNQFGVSYFLTF